MVNEVMRIDLPVNGWGSGTSRDSAPLATSPVELSCFVAGPENRLAATAVRRLLEGTWSAELLAWAHPLTLVGPCGSGKSLLAHALVRGWTAQWGSERVAYYTALDFSRQRYVASCDDRLPEFRDSLAGLKLLVVEDLHKVQSKTAAQRELRDTLDMLSECGGLVVFTSLESPASLPQLDAGLSDRIVGGMLVRLKHPGVAARRELLQLATGRSGSPLDERQLNSLAEESGGSAAQVLQSVRSAELRCITGEPAPGCDRQITMKQIIAVVSRYFGLPQSALCGASRRKSLVRARGVVVYLARSLTDFSYAEIGKHLSRRDHTTIMHAMETVEGLVENDIATQQSVDELARILRAV